jgi:hypothetical protein
VERILSGCVAERRRRGDHILADASLDRRRQNVYKSCTRGIGKSNGLFHRPLLPGSLQFRMDIMNVFNHPEPNVPTFSATNVLTNHPMVNINAANFGVITGADAKTNLHRQFQAQLRFSF